MNSFNKYRFLILIHIVFCILYSGTVKAQDIKAKGAYSTYLPLIVIETDNNEITAGTKINVSCKIIHRGSGLPNDTSAIGNIYSGIAGIEIRGQSSQMFPKKSYSLELRDSTGEGISVPILGMPAEEDWVLHAPYSDKSLMRNALAYYLGGRMTGWQPKFRFCSLVINGDYRGIYMLTEKIKRDRNRVDIAKLEQTENSGDDLTGGYIFKVDKYGDLDPSEYFITYPVLFWPGSRNYIYTYVYPEADEITNEQKQYLSQFITDFENTLNSSSFDHREKGYPKYIDAGSFIDFQIIQELTNNVDGYVFSTFFYKEKDSDGGKMHAGPLWDFDLGFGNVNYSPVNLSTSGWLFPHYNDKYCMHWWARLMDDSYYARMFSARWKEIREGAFHTDSIMNYIDNTIQYLGEEINSNFDRWQITGEWVWPNYHVGNTFGEDVQYLKNWISARLNWIDSNAAGTWIEQSDTFHDNLLLYPVPASDKLYFATGISTLSEIKIEITDITGKLVYSKNFRPQSTGYQEFETDISQLSNGIYIFSLSSGKRLVSRREFIVNNF